MAKSPRLDLIVVSSLLVLFAFASAARGEERFRFTEGRKKGGELKYQQGIPVLVLTGTPEEMGEQQAALLGEAIRPLADMPKKILEEFGAERAWPLLATVGRAMILKAPEHHRAELDTAIERSGVDADMLYVANTMLELRRLGGCSSLIVQPERSATGGPLFGRNFDFPPMGLIDQYSLVAVYRAKGKRPFVSVTFPGIVGVVSGMNDAGLAVATLDVYQSKDGSPMFDAEGVPLMFSYRRILEECATVEEAAELLRGVRRTTWMNLAVCDRRGGAVLEITPKSVEVRRAEDGLVRCTNHFRTEPLARSTDCWRYDRFSQLPKEGRLDRAGVAEAMDSVNQGKNTLQTMIFEPAEMKLHLSLGSPPASSRRLTELDVNELLEVDRE